MPKQVSNSRGAAKAERAFFKAAAKQAKLAKKRQDREHRPERAGQGERAAAEGLTHLVAALMATSAACLSRRPRPTGPHYSAQRTLRL